MRGTVLGEITVLEKLSLADLRQKYAKLFPEDTPSPAISPSSNATLPTAFRK